jgi:membrane protease YdiL (CAAX protease family)
MKPPPTSSRKPVFLYLVMTFALSSVFYTLIISSGHLGGGFGLYVVGLMWCPGLAGIVTTLILKRPLSSLGWRWGAAKYNLQSYLVPLLYAFIAYLIIWIMNWGGFYNEEFVNRAATAFGWKNVPDGVLILVYLVLGGTIGMVRSSASALGEEIGWRGFLVPELYKSLGYTKTSLLTGIIWSVWHYPILLFADYNSGTPAWYGLTCFTVLVISISFIFTWYRVKSGSLWTGVLLHASHNLFIQSFFTPLTRDTGNTRFYTDEFGVVLPAVGICFAIWYWIKRGKLNN